MALLNVLDGCDERGSSSTFDGSSSSILPRFDTSSRPLAPFPSRPFEACSSMESFLHASAIVHARKASYQRRTWRTCTSMCRFAFDTPFPKDPSFDFLDQTPLSKRKIIPFKRTSSKGETHRSNPVVLGWKRKGQNRTARSAGTSIPVGTCGPNTVFQAWWTMRTTCRRARAQASLARRIGEGSCVLPWSLDPAPRG